MTDLWKRFENWLKANAKHLHGELNPGATAEELELLSSEIHQALPEDFRAFYSIHNGQSDNWQSPHLHNHGKLLSTRRMLGEWKAMKQLLDDGAFPYPSYPDQAIQNKWWNEGWLPFCADDSGNFQCIDFSPTPFGRPGQIIYFESQSPERGVEAGSFREWVTTYIEGLEAGHYQWSEDWHGIVHKNDIW